MIPTDLLDAMADRPRRRQHRSLPRPRRPCRRDVDLDDGAADAGHQRAADPGHEQGLADGAQADVRISACGNECRLKRGRSAVTRFLDTTYGETRWTRAALHDWLATLSPALCDRHQPRHAVAGFSYGRHSAPADSRLRTHRRHRLPLQAVRLGRRAAIARSLPNRPTRPCPSSSSRWARRGRSRATSPPTPIMSITSPN
jgi:hypothetical protein